MSNFTDLILQGAKEPIKVEKQAERIVKTWIDAKVPDEVKDLITRLQANGYEAYLVGGCVRDLLLGTTPNDWDICTNALPESVCKVFEFTNRVLPTGLKHGTVTVLSADEPYEITTYRVDGEYADGRRPSDVTFTGQLLDDLARRDFTINAMAYNSTMGVIDPFGGREDLAHQLIRCVGNPEERFKEDSLRILRALRFASCKGFRIEESTDLAVRTLYSSIKDLSAERVLSELLKLLTGNLACTVLMTYPEVITFVMPELEPMLNCKQNNPHHIYNVWEHTCQVIASLPNNAALRVAALFHDSGKPHTKTTDEGVDHFYGHAKVSEEIAEGVLRRLRASNHFISEVLPLIRYHDAEFPNRTSVRRMMNRVGTEQTRNILLLREADILAQSMDTLPPKLGAVHRARQVLSALEEEEACFKLNDLAINGRDLINNGISQGKEIGEILNHLLNQVMDEVLPNEKEILLKEAIMYKST